MKRIPIANEPLRWTHPQLGNVHLYKSGSCWVVDINDRRAFAFDPGGNRDDAERGLQNSLREWSYLEQFRIEKDKV